MIIYALWFDEEFDGGLVSDTFYEDQQEAEDVRAELVSNIDAHFHHKYIIKEFQVKEKE